MAKLIKVVMMAAVTLAAVAGSAPAQQPMMDPCAMMTMKITEEAGRRFDAASYDAKMKAAQAMKLCKEGKKADAEKIVKEAAAALGVKM